MCIKEVKQNLLFLYSSSPVCIIFTARDEKVVKDLLNKTTAILEHKCVTTVRKKDNLSGDICYKLN